LLRLKYLPRYIFRVLKYVLRCSLQTIKLRLYSYVCVITTTRLRQSCRCHTT